MNTIFTQLRAGEHYAGIIINSATGKPTHHLILLPHKPIKALTWPEAMEWAASVGIELPTRQESALLYTNLKPVFEPAWYWTGEQYISDASVVWGQYFGDGTQELNDKNYKNRVRGIRRVPITEN